MPYTSLRDFITFLESKNLLVRIQEEVSMDLEVTEIHKRVIRNGGPALLFENVMKTDGTKSDIPVLVNLFGTVERVALGMNLQPENLRAFGRKLAFLRQPEPPEGFRQAISMLPVLKDIMAMKPKIKKKPPCRQVIFKEDEVDINKLPIQNCWPGEPAPLITWPLVVTKADSNSGIKDYNLGIYRMQVIGKNKVLMRWLKHRGGAEHARRWGKQSGKMPAAAILGADPGTIISAVTPVPDTLSEYEFAGLIRRNKPELADCVSVPLQVPAYAEIVLEGYINFEDYRDEGPYGDHTGYYNSVEQFPVFEITALTMRKDPIYLSTFTSRPPDEPSVLGEALNEVFIPLLQQQFPEIVDFWLPPEGCSYRIAVVSIRKAYPGHAKRIMMGVWSYLRQFTYTKFVIVVDEDINVRDWKDVMWAVSTRMDFADDMLTVDSTPIDYLDFASYKPELGSKLGFDATNKVYPETKREWGKKIYMEEDIVARVDNKWQNYGIDK